MPKSHSHHRLASLILTIAAVGALPSASRAQPAAAPPSDELDAQIVRLLDTTKVDIQFDRIDFSKAIADLRDRFKLNIHVSWSVLEAAGVKRDTRIELFLKQVPLTTVLEYVLLEAGAGEADLGYHVSGGVIVISTQEAIADRTLLRAYDLTDLLTSGYELRRFANTPVLRLQLAGGEATGGTPVDHGGTVGGGGGLGGGGGGAREDEPVAAVFVDVQTVIELIQSTVQPDSWKEAGGNIGTVRPYGNLVIVGQTMEAHRKIEQVLAMLRQRTPLSVDAETAIIRMSLERAEAWRGRAGGRFPRLSADEFRAALAEAGPAGTLFRGVTTGHNGRRLWFSALSQKQVINGVVPLLGQNVWAAQPRTAPVNEGLELIVLPMLAPESDALALDVQMAWSPSAIVNQRSVALGAASARPAPAAPDTRGGGIAPGDTAGVVTGTIDLVTRPMRTVSTMVRLNLGDAIALSIPGDVGAAPRENAPQDWLLIHVRPPGT